MPIIYIDSNVFYADPHFSGTSFRILREYLRRAKCRLFVSEIVIKEVVNKIREGAVKASNDIGRQIGHINHLLGINIKLPISPDEIRNKTIEYETGFRKKLESMKTTIVDYPDVPHKTIVGRTIRRKKPFGEKDKGYRDTLIWLSILPIMKVDRDRVIFITENRKDFFTAENKIHPDLLHDMQIHGIDPKKFSFYAKFENFIDGEVKHTLKSLDDAKKLIQRGKYKHFDLSDWIYSRLPRLLDTYTWDNESLGFPDYCEDVKIINVQVINELRIEDVLLTESGELLIRAAAKIEAEFECFIHKADYYASTSSDEPDFHTEDWNEQYYFAAASAPVDVDFYLTFNRESRTVTSSEILDCDGMASRL